MNNVISKIEAASNQAYNIVFVHVSDPSRRMIVANVLSDAAYAHHIARIEAEGKYKFHSVESVEAAEGGIGEPEAKQTHIVRKGLSRTFYSLNDVISFWYNEKYRKVRVIKLGPDWFTGEVDDDTRGIYNRHIATNVFRTFKFDKINGTILPHGRATNDRGVPYSNSEDDFDFSNAHWKSRRKPR